MKNSNRKYHFLPMIIALVLMTMFGTMTAFSEDTIRETDVSEAGNGKTIVLFEGEFKYLPKEDILARINEIRLEACREGVRDPRNPSRNLTEADYVPIKWSSDLEWIAQLRAAEGSMYMDHERPNGWRCFSAWHNGFGSSGEVLAWNGTADIIYGINQWYGEKEDWVNETGEVTGHYTQMINPSNTYVGIGAFAPTDGLWWGTVAGEFLKGSGYDETQADPIGKCWQKIEVMNDNLNVSIDVSAPIHVGKNVQAKVDAKTTYEGLYTVDSSVKLIGDVAWSSADRSIAIVASDGTITGVSAGNTTITVAVGGTSYNKDVQIEDHIWNSDYTPDKPATCSETGSESIHCSKCDAIKENSSRTIQKKSHSYGDWKTTKKASCTESGSREKVCSKCGARVTEEIPATGHKWNSEYTEDKAATCTEDGSESIHCSVCDAVKENSSRVTQKKHAYGDWETTKPASCTKSGSREKVCSKCGDKITEEIPALGHVWGEPEWTWKDDHTAATAKFTCNNDKTHVETVNAEVTSIIDDSGNTVYTAKVTFEGEEYKDTIKETPQPESDRIYGKDRYETAIEAAEEYKENAGGKLKNVVVAYGGNFPDALSGGYLAKVKEAPILLIDTSDTSIENKIVNYISKNIESGGTVYILGGTGVVKDSFKSKVEGKGIKTKRLGGANRYATNIEILKEAGVTKQELLVCATTGFADSLSASAAGRPILLVDGSLTKEQRDYLRTLRDKGSSRVYLIGGTGVVPPGIVNELESVGYENKNITRINGTNRYQTSTAVANRFFPRTSTVVLAYAGMFPDGLSGGPLAMQYNAPVILTDPGNTAEAQKYVKASGASSSITLGGPTYVTDKAVQAIME